MSSIALGDAIFLLGESPGRPAQVITLQLYRPPAGEDAEQWTAEYFQHLLGCDELKPVFRRRPRRSLLSPSSMRWIEDEPVELDHHVRHSALPGRGRVRELLEAVSAPAPARARGAARSPPSAVVVPRLRAARGRALRDRVQDPPRHRGRDVPGQARPREHDPGSARPRLPPALGAAARPDRHPGPQVGLRRRPATAAAEHGRGAVARRHAT